MSRKHTIYISITAVAIIAMFVDRVILSDGVTGPSSAAAMPTGGANATATNPAWDQVNPSSGGWAIPELPFPRNLPQGEVYRPIRDLFMRPRPPIKEQDEEMAATDEPEDALLLGDSEALQMNRRLQGVMSNGQLEIAIVDGTWLRVGDTIDGCTLIRVSGTQAFFDCQDGETILSLAGVSLPSVD